MELTKSELNQLFFLNRTDAGNAERIAKMVGQDWRYCWQLKCWLHWNGKKWEKVSELALIKPIVTCFRKLAALEFSDIEKKQNPAIDATKKFLLSSENSNRVNGCIKHLQSELVADIETFDTKENLLNLQDCTLDLESGIARSHCREDYLTQISPVKYCKSYNNGLSRQVWYLGYIRTGPKAIGRCSDGIAFTGKCQNVAIQNSTRKAVIISAAFYHADSLKQSD